MARYNEEKIDSAIKTIKKLSEDLDAEKTEDLREQLWKLQREATLLMEFIDNEIYEDEDLRQAM